MHNKVKYTSIGTNTYIGEKYILDLTKIRPLNNF